MRAPWGCADSEVEREKLCLSFRRSSSIFLGRGLSSPARSGSRGVAARREPLLALPAPAPSVPQARGFPALRLGVLPSLRPSPGQGPPEPASGYRGGWRSSALPLCLLAYWVPGGVGHPVSSHYCCTAPSFVGLSSEDHRDLSAQLEEPPRRRGVATPPQQAPATASGAAMLPVILRQLKYTTKTATRAEPIHPAHRIA